LNSLKEKNCIIKAPEVVDVPDEDEVQKTFEMIDLTQEQHVIYPNSASNISLRLI